MRLHHVIDGPSDAAVVLLGGSLGSTLDMWTPQIEALASCFRLVRYDHRGHGGSPMSDGPCTIDDLACDVLELLDDLEVHDAHLVGLSLGAMVAMSIASTRPERVRSLALLCTTAGYGQPLAWHDRAGLVRARGMTAVAPGVVQRWLTPSYARRHPEHVHWFEAMVSGIDPEAYARCCEAIADLDMWRDLDAIAAPALVVAGAEDPAAPPAHARQIVERLGDGRLEVLSPAAHLANYEQALLVNRLLLKHLENVSQR